jgi:alpha-N-arabinofuranosidase
MNEDHHYDLAVTRRAGMGRCLIVRRRIGSLVAEEARVPLAAGPVRLAIEAREALYTFLVAQGDVAWQPVGQGETRYLSTEVAGGFTGVYFGMFASGRGGRCVAPADFDWFEMAALDEA